MYSGQQKFLTSSCTPPTPPPPCASPPNGIAAPPVLTRADPALISAPAVGVRLLDGSVGLVTGLGGVAAGLAIRVDSTMSGGFGGGGASMTLVFGFAISSTARPAIDVIPPVFGPSGPPSDSSIVATSAA